MGGFNTKRNRTDQLDCSATFHIYNIQETKAISNNNLPTPECSSSETTKISRWSPTKAIIRFLTIFQTIWNKNMLRLSYVAIQQWPLITTSGQAARHTSATLIYIWKVPRDKWWKLKRIDVLDNSSKIIRLPSQHFRVSIKYRHSDSWLYSWLVSWLVLNQI